MGQFVNWRPAIQLFYVFNMAFIIFYQLSSRSALDDGIEEIA